MVASYKQLALASRGCRSEERNQENAAQDASSRLRAGWNRSGERSSSATALER